MTAVTESQYKYRPFRITWNNMALRDPAAINLTLASAAVWKRQAMGLPGPPDNFNKYYTTALTNLNARLGGSETEQTSEGAIIAVLGLACSDVCAQIRNFREWWLMVL